MKALSNIVIINNKQKENIQYFDITAIVYITHNLSLYIIPNLDYQTTKNKTQIIIFFKYKMSILLTFMFQYVLIRNEHIQIKLNNIHYLPKLDANLISFEVLEEKRYEFCNITSFLQMNNKKNDILMKFFKDNNIYLLQQPRLLV